jgi:cytochrome c oxidase subunit 4
MPKGDVTMERQIGGAAYVLTFVALLVLATASLLLSFVQWPGGNLVVAVAIALGKALLVAFFFMHLAEQSFTSRMTMLVSVLFVALLVGLASADVATRHTLQARPEPAATQPFYTR